ncbi:hypothetical protein GW17_00016922 [Ensete ventricosum]|uniref:Uncharacterized protein n=1 Tax=Ensete ventricosum TaxID=4639 RepID=A0A444F8U0_ENSVE|nr:hypothetical protein B296_00011131 [Ensete ventricosum]RWW19055.1 hypothetical protein GW17_00016922 [Ensete ventricosum]
MCHSSVVIIRKREAKDGSFCYLNYEYASSALIKWQLVYISCSDLQKAVTFAKEEVLFISTVKFCGMHLVA